MLVALDMCSRSIALHFGDCGRLMGHGAMDHVLWKHLEVTERSSLIIQVGNSQKEIGNREEPVGGSQQGIYIYIYVGIHIY